MLEWYRLGFNLDQLQDDVRDLLSRVCAELDVDLPAIETRSYRDLFENRFGVNPHQASERQLEELAAEHFPNATQHLSYPQKNDWLDVLFSQGVEPNLVEPTFVTEFPSSQASLANVAERAGDRVALSVELYWQGVELANGYDELRDPEELERRIMVDNDVRQRQGLDTVVADQSLLDAMKTLPACAGIALGVERLLMVLSDETNLGSVLVDQ